MKEPPVFVDAYQLALGLHQLELPPSPVSARVRTHALGLLEAIALALRGGGDLQHWLEDADVLLLRVRLGLRLLLDLEERPALIALTAKVDDIGRQIGGWKRKLGRG